MTISHQHQQQQETLVDIEYDPLALSPYRSSDGGEWPEDEEEEEERRVADLHPVPLVRGGEGEGEGTAPSVPERVDEAVLYLDPETRSIFEREQTWTVTTAEDYQALRERQAMDFHTRASQLALYMKANLLELGWMIVQAEELALYTYIGRTDMKEWMTEVGLSRDMTDYARNLARIWPHYQELGYTVHDLLDPDMTPIKAQHLLGLFRNATRQRQSIKHELLTSLVARQQQQQVQVQVQQEEEEKEEERGEAEWVEELSLSSESDEEEFLHEGRKRTPIIVESSLPPSSSPPGRQESPPPVVTVKAVPLTAELEGHIEQESYTIYVARARTAVTDIVHNSEDKDLIKDSMTRHGKRQKPQLIIGLCQVGDGHYQIEKRDLEISFDDLLALQKGQVTILFALPGKSSFCTMKEMADYFLDQEEKHQGE